MAAQTDAPDDLIAELAKLMADDARTDHTSRADQPAGDKPAAVRIPGNAAPAPAAAPAAAVRIPGDAPQPKKPDDADPFRFNFDLNLPGKAAGPTTPLIPQPEPPRSAQPMPPSDPLPLDQDGLADLIAAELANDLAGAAEPLPAASGPARGEDNFGVPPVFGLSSPAVPAPAPEPVLMAADPVETPAEPPRAPVSISPEPEPEPAASDPLADIERLVGPAVQLSNDQAETVRAPSPALRSLATPTLPVTEARPVGATSATEPSSVDEAILAAAAATGAHIEWVDPALNHPDAEYEEEVLPPPRRPMLGMSRAVAGPVFAVALLGVAGLGLYWALGQGTAPTGPAPLLVADTAPIKEVPEPAAEEPQQSVVFNEISGTDSAAEEQLVPRDQADETAMTEAASPSATGNVLASDESTGIDPNQDGLVNRKVRTVTVRPDGTIISGTDSLAGASILPVDRPNVPDVPGADFSTPDMIASTIASADTGAEATATTPTPEATVVPQVATVEPGATIEVVDAAGAPISGRTVTVPMQRPADFAEAAAAALSASAQPATNTAPAASLPAEPAASSAAPTTAATSSVGDAAAYVQLASQRSEEAAQQTVQAVTTRYGVLFSGVTPQIQRVDLGERGIYYRVLVPAPSRDAAANICTNIQAAGGDCLLL